MKGDASHGEVPQILIPDIRDYERVNAELIELLQSGHSRVRLSGAEGQRFLAAGLTGPWNAVVEVEGRAGPELAAGMNAPGVTVVCQGAAADGAGSRLRNGRLVLLSDAGEGLAYAQQGGTVLATQNAGNRAGLNQQGGVLIVLGAVGNLAGERQDGGWFFAFERRLGRHSGRAHRAGRLVRLPEAGAASETVDAEALTVLKNEASELALWLKGTSLFAS